MGSPVWVSCGVKARCPGEVREPQGWQPGVHVPAPGKDKSLLCRAGSCHDARGILVCHPPA